MGAQQAPCLPEQLGCCLPCQASLPRAPGPCPAGWKDSPLGSFSAGQLARLLSDSLGAQLADAGGSGGGGGGANPLNSSGGLPSPALHRLARGSPPGTRGTGSPAGGSGGVSRRPSGGSLASGLNLGRLFSSVSSEAELLSALQVGVSGESACAAHVCSPAACPPAACSAPGLPRRVPDILLAGALLCPQWLDSLDPAQLATLAALDSPRSADTGAGGPAGAGAGAGGGGDKGAAGPAQRGAPGPSRLGQR